MMLIVGLVGAAVVASLCCYLPFLFAFQLIADRNLTGMDAVKTSLQGVKANLFGLLGYSIALALVSLILTFMCVIPAYLFMPISFASMFDLYREIYGRPPSTS
jgi:uncharacterized membrane protein